MNVVNENEWGDLECLYKTCQEAIIDGGLFTDSGVNERGENEWQSDNDNEMKLKLGQGPREPIGVGVNRLRRKGLIKAEGFELKVKLM